MKSDTLSDLRLIEHGFPCHQVGAETRRERGASSALPPLYFLHVWWARRPLTPSRAAILAALAPAGTDVEKFVRELGIEKRIVEIGGNPWVLTGKLLEHLETDSVGNEVLRVAATVEREFEKEQVRRKECLDIIARLREAGGNFQEDPLLRRWESECQPFTARPSLHRLLPVRRIMADPDHVNQRIEFAKRPDVEDILGHPIRWDAPDLYGYTRGYSRHPLPETKPMVVLDPTSGGGSIPFEALRCGHQVIANELNPVATVILHATLDYPARFGPGLVKDIDFWGNKLIANTEAQMEGLAPFSELPDEERDILREQCKHSPEILPEFDVPEYDHTGLLHVRTVTCPHCGGHAPLLNTCWLSKEAGDQWGVRVVTKPDRTVSFETYRCSKGRGPNGEDPEPGTVNRGTGQCVHCKQAIDGDEIKAQARGESPRGKWWDTLFAIAAVRFEPVLDAKGKPIRYASGTRKGEIKNRKVRFFRPPNERDSAALAEALERIAKRWDDWDAKGLIPTESIDKYSNYDRGHRMYGVNSWRDFFTPRQLLGSLILVEELIRMKPSAMSDLGPERGKAVITYLQFAIDKVIDYNSSATRWHFGRGVIVGTFGRHNYSIKWTYGEMPFTGPNPCFSWGLSQVIDAYAGIAELLEPVFKTTDGKPSLQIINGSATHMGMIGDESVDLVCMDPPYYDNVQYAELSDYYYVWQRRTLRDLYPNLFSRRLTNKEDEAVANPVRDGSKKKAGAEYERMMREIFAECRRVVKPDGIMTLMFTHKSQDAWEALTRAIIESNWTITASFPVDSESENSSHQMDVAAAASSIFIACRKRSEASGEQAVWEGFGGTGVAPRIREEVRQGLKDFARLRLNPVDEMVASYGRALRVLSENWPVLDGDQPVTPIRAMNEASRVVAENQIARITKGSLMVSDLSSEAAMALTLFGIFGHQWFPYDEALNLSKSLNIALEGKGSGYELQPGRIGINTEVTGRGRAGSEEKGYHAPLVRNGSKLRLALPAERAERRIKDPQTEWDLLHGLLLAYRKGDTPVARAYLDEHAPDTQPVLLNLLKVWETEIGDPKLEKEAKALLFGLS